MERRSDLRDKHRLKIIIIIIIIIIKIGRFGQ